MAGLNDESEDFGKRVRSAVFWRSGSQMAAQLVMWSSTFIVIRLLEPSDYGLFAMTQIVLSLMSLMNGYSFTGALVQSDEVNPLRMRQVFGMLILMNFGLAATQFLMAPLAAEYFRTPLVADMLRVQSLLHLASPFIMMPQAMLSRTIDFRTQARVNLASAFFTAMIAPTAAYLGLGVWTLVLAPLVLFYSRAIGLAIAGRWWIWPSFRFAGAGATLGFGGAMLASELLWFVQTQADVFIGGRHLAAHDLGIYTTALFLSQILVNKFVPPLNEVAFPAYSRLQADRAAVAWSFAKSVRVIMLVAMPFSLGLAVTAEPLVLTVLGSKWAEAAPVVRILACAMPFVTLQILYAPAANALGRPGISAIVSGAGALIMPVAFLIGVSHGPIGLAWSWLIGFPLLCGVATMLSLPVIGLAFGDLVNALRPSVAAGLLMAVAVLAVERVLPPLSPAVQLLVLVPTGAAIYGAALLLFGRSIVAELLDLVRRRSTVSA